jgi:hypothetical protein
VEAALSIRELTLHPTWLMTVDKPNDISGNEFHGRCITLQKAIARNVSVEAQLLCSRVTGKVGTKLLLWRPVSSRAVPLAVT